MSVWVWVFERQCYNGAVVFSLANQQLLVPSCDCWWPLKASSKVNPLLNISGSHCSFEAKQTNKQTNKRF